MKKDLNPLKEEGDLANYKIRKSFKTKEIFNASIVRNMVNLL